MSTRPVNKGKRSSTSTPSHKTGDIVGIVCIALALIAGVSLVLSDSGIVGQALSNFLRLLFGQGSWVVCVCLFLLGAGSIAGKRRISINQLGMGLTLVFLAILGAIAQPLGSDFFDPSVVTSSGGYVGAIMGWASFSLLGAGKLIGLVALGLIGFVLAANTSIRAMLETAHSKAKSLAPKRTATVAKKAVTRAVVQERTVERSRPQADDVQEEPRRKPTPIFHETEQRELEFAEVEHATPKEGYKLPPLTLLANPPARQKRTPQEMQENIETLESTLEEFGIDANVVEVATGPTLTRYEIQLGPGIKVSRIGALGDNIAMNLSAAQVRVEAPIPGKNAVGVEVPNAHRYAVSLRELCESQEFRDHPSRLCIALGQDVAGRNMYADLAKMPHILIGGATNSGKSIGLATVIMSLLMRNTPKDVRFVMIDPKRVELSLFNDVPHLMCPVIKDVKEAAPVLRALCREMDRRYDILSEAGVRNIDGWNEKASFQEKMSYIVVVIDELADLMIAARAEVETAIVRLAQLARAVGIHLVIATQRPSVDVITGLIKANIPSRLAFAVSSQVDSRTILDEGGAERLIGRGDMLFSPIDANKPTRIQGCYVTEKEIEGVGKFWKEQERPQYQINPVELARQEADAGRGERGGSGDDEIDALWRESVLWVVERGQASTSMLQRRFSIGFQRASRLLDMMEERGIVGPRDGPRPRDVLVNIMEAEEMVGGGSNYDGEGS
ncbi:MAG: DNA translocase FtsK 4TM domain-containing protein [Fimbriimonadaceae bacterium]|nr:DNA translocase FtsK 4TM domain-containing protein [Fimbriimonadaceae bacterium]